MTIAADCQLTLPITDVSSRVDSWERLPEQARAAVLVLLARLIARSVLTPADAAAEPVGGGEAEHG